MPFKNPEARNLYMKRYRESKKLEQCNDLQSFLKAIHGCPKCQSNPLTFITKERIPLCRKHWYALADSDIEF